MSRLSSRGSAWEALRAAVLERDGGICVYCGNEATTADHVTPKALGGRDELANLVAACLKCNGRKSDQLLLRSSGFNPRWLDGLW
ncbi:HNH endonuclease [Microbacterium hominis]|uniref:HNH endonuclease n=1 Tax=Microbacterium hominis TaxID=162426 RepID=UPI00196331B8|nr:HNH endonuclease [Microbacterium hominis]QRY40856.1 HNH endonuclease [Microbacterium hominis]